MSTAVGGQSTGDTAAPTKARILVVDDDRLVLATVVHGLSQAGYEVIDADNGDDAILLARQHRPQLALLDIRMEGKSGFDVAQTLRDAYGIPFMFLSAFSDPATLAQGKALGAQAYLIKPLDVGQIVPSVAEVLERLAGSASAHESAHESARDSARQHPLAPVAESAALQAALAPSPAPEAVAAATQPVWDEPVSIAVGVLMHRHGLSRQQAWSRLQALAQGGGRTVTQQAERLLLALEELAQSGPANA